MSKVVKYVVLWSVQGAAAFALAAYLITPAIRKEPFLWERQAAAETLENENQNGEEEAPEPSHFKRQKKKSRDMGALLPIESVIVNVADTQGRRFLKASLTLEMETGEVADVQARLPVLRGAVIDVLASRNLDDLTSPDARSVIREEILETLNSKDEDLKFKDLFFTEFIVQ
jgi:flagellar protein FliL